MTETRKETVINLGNMKSIFITRSFGDKVTVAININGGYAYVTMEDDKLDQLIDALKEFRRETV